MIFAKLNEFAMFVVEEIKLQAENATIGQRFYFGFSGTLALFTSLAIGWAGIELVGSSHYFRGIGVAWIGLGAVIAIIGCVEIWVALYPLIHRARHWIRRVIGIGLFTFVVFVTAPYTAGESCRGDIGDWLCTASACLTALCILVGTLLVTSGHRHGRR